jgi:uncharacterized protein
MSRIAVIGSGISGLAAAYYLSRKHEVFLFESEARLGGHTHTVTVDSSRGPLAVDTGFIVHNDRTYPNLIKLLGELGVPRTNSDMSFAVSCRKSGYEYSSRGLRGYFAQKRNVLRARSYKLFGEMRRFNREAPQIFQRNDADRLKLGEFLDERRYTQEFRHYYLFPMAAAVWSCAPNAVKEFPAAMLIRFFDNHGMLTINGHPQWKTIPGGCSRYIAPITAPLKGRIFTNVKIRSVARDEQGVTLRFSWFSQPMATAFSRYLKIRRTPNATFSGISRPAATTWCYTRMMTCSRDAKPRVPRGTIFCTSMIATATVR